MRILDGRHVPEAALAELADDAAARQQFSPSDRQHLDTCDRCRGLLEGHRRAAQLFAAPWGFLTADQVSSAPGIQRVRGVVSVGGARGTIRLSSPVWVGLALLLLSALIGTGLFVGANRTSVGPPPAVYAGPSEVPSPSPSPNLLDTSTWTAFTSARYGLEISHPAGWRVVASSAPWDLVVDQSYAGFLPSTDRFLAPNSSKTFAAYGIALPEGTAYEAFIEAYRAPNVTARGIRCFPAPAEWERITIDGHVAGRVSGLLGGCDYIEAMLLADGRVYIFSLYSALASDRPLFDAFLSTVRLDPAAADDTPVDDASPSPG